MAKVTLEFDVGYTEGGVEGAIVSQAATALVERFDEKLNEEVDSLIRKKVEEIAAAEIRARVVDVLERGFTRTNKYGKAIHGSLPMTLKERVGKMLTETKRYERGYDSPQETIIDHVIREEIGKLAYSEFKKEVEVAKKKFQEAIDGVVKEKLADTLKNALGLR